MESKKAAKSKYKGRKIDVFPPKIDTIERSTPCKKSLRAARICPDNYTNLAFKFKTWATCPDCMPTSFQFNNAYAVQLISANTYCTSHPMTMKNRAIHCERTIPWHRDHTWVTPQEREKLKSLINEVLQFKNKILCSDI